MLTITQELCMPKIHLPQKNLILEVHAGANLMKTLLDAGIPVASSCLGDGICGKCRLMTEGEVSKIVFKGKTFLSHGVNVSLISATSSVRVVV